MRTILLAYTLLFWVANASAQEIHGRYVPDERVPYAPFSGYPFTDEDCIHEIRNGFSEGMIVEACEHQEGDAFSTIFYFRYDDGMSVALIEVFGRPDADECTVWVNQEFLGLQRSYAERRHIPSDDVIRERILTSSYKKRADACEVIVQYVLRIKKPE